NPLRLPGPLNRRADRPPRADWAVSGARFNRCRGCPTGAWPRSGPAQASTTRPPTLKRIQTTVKRRSPRAKPIPAGARALPPSTATWQRTPTDRPATAERLLATYQVYVLYLGNIDDPALRPEAVRQAREDVARLAAGTPAEKYLATLVDALAAHRYAAGVAAVESGARGPVPLQTMPDVAMVEADVLFHAAEEAFGAESAAAEDESRVPVRRRREDLARRAVQSLRRGLDADPNHVGLLFLKANSLQMRAVWDTEG